MIDFPKLIQLNELSDNGEPTIQIVRPYEVSRHIKMASEAIDFINHVKPEPGKTLLLVLAMTAGEYYGPNRNGDGWPEEPLQVGPTKITADEVLPKHYHTFENAHVFKHHVNKDPAKAIGDIVKAFYNWPMHRVELLIRLDNRKAEDIVERVERDEFPAVSMGCRVKYDVCSICGNKAPNRRHYCDHARFALGDFHPDGRRILVWNPNPRFFDLSMVRRPADELGYTMLKVAENVPNIVSSAELGEYVENTERKLANLRKLSVIDKVLRGDVIAVSDQSDAKSLEQLRDHLVKPACENMGVLGEKDIRSMLPYRPAEVLSTLTALGIVMSMPEFLKYFVWKLSPDMNIPESVLDRAIGAIQNVFEILTNNPDLISEIDEIGFTDIDQDNVRSGIAEKLSYLQEIRSQKEPYLHRHFVPSIYGKHATKTAGNQSLLSEARKNKLQKMLGAGGLLYGAYVLSTIPRLRWVGLAPAIAGGYLGYESLKPDVPEIEPSDAMFGMAQNYTSSSPWSGNKHPRVRGLIELLGRKHASDSTSLSFEAATTKLGEVICPWN